MPAQKVEAICGNCDLFLPEVYLGHKIFGKRCFVLLSERPNNPMIEGTEPCKTSNFVSTQRAKAESARLKEID
jgi:hypothetical protein